MSPVFDEFTLEYVPANYFHGKGSLKRQFCSRLINDMNDKKGSLPSLQEPNTSLHPLYIEPAHTHTAFIEESFSYFPLHVPKTSKSSIPFSHPE